MVWKEFVKDKRKVKELAVTVLVLAIVLFFLPGFLKFVETRPGVVLPDPILNLFDPIDLTWLTFILIYGSLILSLYKFSFNPSQLLLALQLYIVMVVVRIIAMYLVPLDPPAKMISLIDPFVEYFGTGQTLTKDLFFSGHTATLFILFIVSEKGFYKTLFLVSTLLVAFSVLLQHVHYTIDVFAALFFTYSSYLLLLKLKKIIFNTA